MHVLFVHKEYPGHFGHVAAYLAKNHDFQCTFVYNNIPTRLQKVQGAPPSVQGHSAQITVSQTGLAGSAPVGDRTVEGVRLIPYQTRGAARDTNPCSLHFEISTWHNQAVLHTLRDRTEIRPNLIVAHSGYGTALHLQCLYQCPLISYCEYYHRLSQSHLTFRREYPPREADLLARHAFNAVNLLSLEEAAACYSPTAWQRSVFPDVYHPKIATIFDGIDRGFWYRRAVRRAVGGAAIPAETRIVTYCSYGLEPTRGFDVFMRVAKRICDVRNDVLFVVVGADRSYYAPGHGDEGRTFRDHVLAQDRYDLGRFLFTGQILEEQLVEILSLSDLHVYLTVPFVLSWSLFDALACGCTVLASDTAPVREVVADGQNGLLAGFDDVDGLTRQALRVLDDPGQFRPLGEAATRLIDEKYRMEVTGPQTAEFYRRVATQGK